jgi:molecular chaperone GrpE
MSKHKKHSDYVGISPEAEEEARAALESAAGAAPTDSELDRPALTGQDYADLKLKYDQLIRTAADLDNQRKRALRERDESLKYGQERLLSELLPIVDNLNRTLKSVPEQSHDPLLKSLGAGLKMILKQFADVLAKYSVESFSSVGQLFDPNWHEALLRTETTDYPPGTIIDELSQGYKIRGRLLRPAMVNVAYPPTAAVDEGEIEEIGSSG